MDTLELILSKIFPVALAILGPVILALVSLLVKKLNYSLGIKNNQATDDAIMSIVQQAVSYTEQIASNLAKKEEEIHGQEKLNIALDYAFEQLQKSGIINQTSEDLTKKIEAMLGSRILEGGVVVPEQVVDNTDNMEDNDEDLK